PEQIVGLHDRVDLPRALVDDGALAVPVEPPYRILVRVAVGTVNLYGVSVGSLRRDRHEPLREAGLAGVAPALVLQKPGSEPEQPRGLIVPLHLRNHLFHELMLRDLDAEGRPLLRVSHARIPARANEARG